MNTICQLSKYALQELKDSYCECEISAICKIIYTDVLHFTNIDIHLRKNEILAESFINKFYRIIGQLKKGQPLQYILGETLFDGLKFHLNTSTLIPRPETQELVHWLKNEMRPGQKILDIGTGSGCIAISLAHSCPDVQVTAIDISAEALETARTNAALNQVKVEFQQRDILKYDLYNWDHFDIIVSNPPYVRECEKKEMDIQVLEHEPRQALFVPDDDPLVFYRQIACFGRQYLNPNGMLFFEINEALGNETIALLERYAYQHTELRKDIFGKERMVKCTIN